MRKPLLLRTLAIQFPSNSTANQACRPMTFWRVNMKTKSRNSSRSLRFKESRICSWVCSCTLLTVVVLIPAAARSNAWVCCPLTCWNYEFESHHRHKCLSLLSVVCCQVEVSTTGRSLVQRSPSECNVSEGEHTASKMRRPWHTRGPRATKKKNKVAVLGNDALRNDAINLSLSAGIHSCVANDES
jgi:hypothetical protein